MGIRQGTTLRADCGSAIVYVADCPDDEVARPSCACGCEFSIVTHATSASTPPAEAYVPGRRRDEKPAEPVANPERPRL